MGFKERIKKQTCVHWSKTGVDSRGYSTYATPVEKDCRWTDINLEYKDHQGNNRMSKSIVFVDGVSVGDVLLLGNLVDSGLDLDDPLQNSEAWEITRYDKIPNLKNTVTWYKAYL